MAAREARDREHADFRLQSVQRTDRIGGVRLRFLPLREDLEGLLRHHQHGRRGNRKRQRVHPDVLLREADRHAVPDEPGG